MTTPLYLFVNPHIHHSYFTVLAISQVGSVFLICPPLQLEIYRGLWKKQGLNIHQGNPAEKSIQSLSLIAFLLFKCHLLGERLYIAILNRLSGLFVALRPGAIFIHYQDYISLPNKARAMISRDICELIIRTNDQLPNWSSTLKAIRLASTIVVPTPALLEQLPDLGSDVVRAPYGGDKSNYKLLAHALPRMKEEPHGSYVSNIIVTARANSFRKGLDILLNALQMLDSELETNAKLCCTFRIFICGAVRDLSSQQMLSMTRQQLSHNGRIYLDARQYSQDDYLNKVHSSHLFVMPSRLEGSSPAALEALWLGVPSILSPQCGVDQFTHNTHGLLLTSPAPESLFNAMISIARTPELLDYWRKCLGRDRERFSWVQYMTSYRSILKTPVAETNND